MIYDLLNVMVIFTVYLTIELAENHCQLGMSGTTKALLLHLLLTVGIRVL